ncbi:MAG: hypothetical protein PSW75_04465, partial [bacterium]|nr:hypothetical protein [bacterium]
SALEKTTRAQLAALQDAAAKLDDKLKATLAKIAEVSVTVVAPPVGGVPSPRVEAKPEPVAEPAPSPIVESVAVVDTAATGPSVVDDSKPRKPRAPRKPKPEDTLAAMSAEPAAGNGHSGESPFPDAPAEPASAAPAEAAVSSDGATRLLATAYIGIGNKLFIRGDGPGLSWDKGVPMQFVSIGKWG